MPAKDTKVTDPKYLEVLEKARAKALEVRRKKADEKRQIRLAEQLEHNEKLKAAQAKLGGKEAVKAPRSLDIGDLDEEPRAAPILKKTIVKPPKTKPVEVEQDEEEDEEEDTASSAPPPTPPKPPMVRAPPATEAPQQGRGQLSREEIRAMQFRRIQASLFGW